MSGIKDVFGGASVNEGRAFQLDTLPEVFDILEKAGCTIVDTAALYGSVSFPRYRCKMYDIPSSTIDRARSC